MLGGAITRFRVVEGAFNRRGKKCAARTPPDAQCFDSALLHLGLGSLSLDHVVQKLASRLHARAGSGKCGLHLVFFSRIILMLDKRIRTAHRQLASPTGLTGEAVRGLTSALRRTDAGEQFALSDKSCHPATG
jgi:hypothetical protein